MTYKELMVEAEAVGDGFFTNYKAWETDDMPFRCKLCSHGQCIGQLSQGIKPSCEAYTEYEKWLNDNNKSKENVGSKR